ncbi:MAG: rod shape-determining protein [Candidatus Nealsonbacteria bacterium CG02_land_8_20_14_3_00_37_10]|uniref:Cell shape-determining protein MreB n=2 Tax=Candidatus Nealsoniibacteriota TaxID=1817911 RepID=A0A2G9YYW2_9BACT|nr:MAG: rod shape-determining protein [Candidatus Nealsonbacteria bacterium CG23_combo_of_CG06-09_8_20_14_all_37_18]PIV44878.1 MAG: rod shape-determining protein [Candidatus Nealsonbacteria bacterium CG02_land_8_20_14_3_00_37_10]
MFNKLLHFVAEDIAIDLGTANSRVYVRGRGIVITEPSVVAVNQKTGQILAIGEEAKKMVGRTPAYIVATRPLVSGVVSNFEVTEQMLRYFIEKAHKRRFLLNPRPRVIIGIPCGITEVEKKAVNDAAKNAGARDVFIIEEPMAAALGARLPVQEAGGNFIVDIGGGTTDIAVISLGGIVISKTLRVAGDKLNQDIIQFAQDKYKLLIGERTAEMLKIGIGSAYPLKEKKQLPMRGRNLVTGLPEEILVSDEDIKRALEKSVKQIVEEIKRAVEETPPELLADIMVSGVQMAGGGSLLKGLATLIQKETKIPTKVIEDPMTAVVRGAGMVLENLDQLQEVLVETEELEPPR